MSERVHHTSALHCQDINFWSDGFTPPLSPVLLPPLIQYTPPPFSLCSPVNLPKLGAGSIPVEHLPAIAIFPPSLFCFRFSLPPSRLGFLGRGRAGPRRPLRRDPDFLHLRHRLIMVTHLRSMRYCYPPRTCIRVLRTGTYHTLASTIVCSCVQ